MGSVLAAVFAGVLLFLVVRFASQNPGKANLGSSVLPLNADRLAAEIDARGPVLFKDPLNRDREVFVQHLGADVEKGWLAVGAYASEVRLECLLEWRPSAQRFLDPCTDVTYAPDGTGLTTYPAPVVDGQVRVDLRTPNP